MSQYSEFVNKLSSLTGLHTDVLNAWVAREQGVNNNILGTTSGGSLNKYPSQTAAAIDTARWINTFPQYAGIKASAGGTSAQQALAISKSPWHLGPTGLAKAGGIDPYYYKGFVQAGILSGSSTPSGGTSTPIVPSGNTTTLDQLLGLPPNTPIDNNTFSSISSAIDNALSSGKIDASVASGLKGTIAKELAALGLGGKSITLGEIPVDKTTGNTVENGLFGTGATLPNIDIPGALMFVAVILVGITFLVLGGIIVLKRPT